MAKRWLDGVGRRTEHRRRGLNSPGLAAGTPLLQPATPHGQIGPWSVTLRSRYHGRWSGSAVRCGPRFPLTRLRPRSSSYTAKARPCAWRPHFLRDGLLRGPFPVADSYLWRIRIWIVCTRPLFGALLSVSCRRLPSLCLYLVGSVSVTSLCLPPSICSLYLSSPVALSALLYVASVSYTHLTLPTN